MYIHIIIRWWACVFMCTHYVYLKASCISIFTYIRVHVYFICVTTILRSLRP